MLCQTGEPEQGWGRSLEQRLPKPRQSHRVERSESVEVKEHVAHVQLHSSQNISEKDPLRGLLFLCLHLCYCTPICSNPYTGKEHYFANDFLAVKRKY